MNAEPASRSGENLAPVVRGLELSIARIGAMLQGQVQQDAATLELLTTLRSFLGELASDTLATRARVDALSILLEARLPAPSLPDAAAHAAATFVTVRPLAALGSRMIQHMVAMSIAAGVQDGRISGVHLPEWGLVEPELVEASEPDIELDAMRVDVGALVARLRRGEAHSIAVTGPVQNIANFLSPEAYRRTFVGPIDVLGYGPKVLLISLRSDETAAGSPFVPIPPAFYRQIIDETGLKPVFFGQLAPSPYLDALKAAFPTARFVAGKTAIHDFETIRRSRNIVVSVSTLAWLAAWLSNATRVFLPLAGLFNPMFGAAYAGGHNLVPSDDDRYRLFLFPLGVAADQAELPAYHAAIDGTWREVTADALDDLLDGRRLLPRSAGAYLSLFDEDYYVGTYPDVRQAIDSSAVGSGRDHYERQGFAEGRAPFELDLHYAVRHPSAGIAISGGEFSDLHHFHVERGHALGYAPTRRVEVPPKPAARARRSR